MERKVLQPTAQMIRVRSYTSIKQYRNKRSPSLQILQKLPHSSCLKKRTPALGSLSKLPKPFMDAVMNSMHKKQQSGVLHNKLLRKPVIQLNSENNVEIPGLTFGNPIFRNKYIKGCVKAGFGFVGPTPRFGGRL